VTRWFFDVRFLFFSAYVLVCLCACVLDMVFWCYLSLAVFGNLHTCEAMDILDVLVLFHSRELVRRCLQLLFGLRRCSFHLLDKRAQSLELPFSFSRDGFVLREVIYATSTCRGTHGHNVRSVLRTWGYACAVERLWEA
jgi:hypothetical protein